MTLDLSSLEKAINTLSASIHVAQNSTFMAQLGIPEKNTIQAGVIQRFEFTYELSWKFIQRWIRANKTPEDAEPRTRKDLFRMAARFNLIANPNAWFIYSEARNITAHTYDQSTADKVFNVAIQFLPDAQALLKNLELMND